MSDPAQLLEELLQLFLQLGHRCRLVWGHGPRLSLALARLEAKQGSGARVLPPRGWSSEYECLHLRWLELSTAELQFWEKLGISTLGQLRALPRSVVAARLSNASRFLLELSQGHDEELLQAAQFLPQLEESQEFSSPLTENTQLLFTLRGLCSRISQRLRGRGEACSQVQLLLSLESSSKLRLLNSVEEEKLKLSTPLWRSAELFRVLETRLAQRQLPAALRAVCLRVQGLSPREEQQLSLDGSGPSLAQLKHLPLLFNQLAVELPPEAWGCLQAADSLLPEERSYLRPFDQARLQQSQARTQRKGKGAQIASFFWQKAVCCLKTAPSFRR